MTWQLDYIHNTFTLFCFFPCLYVPCSEGGDGNKQNSLCSGRRLRQVHQGGLHPPTSQHGGHPCHHQAAQRSYALQDLHQCPASQTGGQVQTGWHGLSSRMELSMMTLIFMVWSGARRTRFDWRFVIWVKQESVETCWHLIGPMSCGSWIMWLLTGLKSMFFSNFHNEQNRLQWWFDRLLLHSEWILCHKSSRLRLLYLLF